MGDLPELRRQRWLLEELGRLIRRAGRKHLETAALVQATEAFFPDRWVPDLHGVERMLKRLLRHVGLGSREVFVRAFDVPRIHEHAGLPGKRAPWSKKGMAAWFGGTRNGVLLFGVDLDLLDNPESLVGVLAHEVSHAYRMLNELMVDDDDEEELLTDLTTVYLGFGILTANASDLRTTQSDEGFAALTTASQVGYLRTQDFCFLLAAQATFRPGDRREIERALGPNQAQSFRVAFKALDQKGARLKERMGLGASARPAASAVEGVGRPTPRTRSRMTLPLALSGFVLGLLVAGFLLHLLPGHVLGPIVAAPALLLGAIGWSVPIERCGAKGCGARLGRGDFLCARCGGIVAPAALPAIAKRS